MVGGSVDEGALREQVNLDQPLGPRDTEPLAENEQVFLDLYDKWNGVHRQSKIAHPYYVIGRKGAGKTAFLIGTALADKTDVARIESKDVYTRLRDLVNEYTEAHGEPVADELAFVWEVIFFHAAMLTIVRSKRAYLPGPAREAVWNYLSGFGDPRKLRDDNLYAKVVSLISAALKRRSGNAFRDDCWSISMAGHSFIDAVVKTRELLEKPGPKAVHVVVDNMEDLHRRLYEFGPVITGLFRLVGRGRAGDGERFPFRLRFAFPAELLDGLTGLAANAGKDFGNRLVISWNAQELMALAGNRLRLFLDLYFPRAAREFGLPRQHDFRDTEAAHLTLRSILPDEVENGLGGTEKGEAYLMRHTQLLPRHLVVMLNRVVGSAVLGMDRDDVPRVTPEQLVSGIFEAEREVLDEVFSAYEFSHPRIKEHLGVLKNKIAIVEKASDLHSTYNKTGLHKRGGPAFAEFLQNGVDIGAFGVVTSHSERYTEAWFSYTFVEDLIPNEDEDDVCVHPLFIQHLFDHHKVGRMAERGQVAVYPYGSDPSHSGVQA
jgi:hypothetical protein